MTSFRISKGYRIEMHGLGRQLRAIYGSDRNQRTTSIYKPDGTLLYYVDPNIEYNKGTVSMYTNARYSVGWMQSYPKYFCTSATIFSEDYTLCASYKEKGLCSFELHFFRSNIKVRINLENPLYVYYRKGDVTGEMGREEFLCHLSKSDLRTYFMYFC